MQRLSAQDRAKIADLSQRLGSLEFRTYMSRTGGSERLMRPERLTHWLSGTGRISEAERDRLGLVSINAPLLENLAKKNQSKNRLKRIHATRDWLLNGKEKGVDYHSQDQETKQRQLKAIKALRFLGIDPSEGTYYVRKRKLA